jgi:hypothetical protein
MKKFLKIVTPMIILSIVLAGWGHKEYFSAVKAQNETIHHMNLQREHEKYIEEQHHEEYMVKILQTSLNAAAQTPDKMDDVLIPVLLMNMENQRTMAKALMAGKERQIAFQPIKAPETFGEAVKNSTGAILGIGGIIVGLTQSNNLKDVAVAGMNAAGTHNIVSGDGNSVINDSYKSGSQNTMTGDGNSVTSGNLNINNCADGSCEEGEEGEAGITGEAGAESTTSDEASTGLLQCIQSPPAGYRPSDSLPLYTPTCSCKSHFAGKC